MDAASYLKKEIIIDERLREREKGPGGNNHGMFKKRWDDHNYHEEISERIRSNKRKANFDEVMFMKLVQAEQKQIERIVDISKAAFDSDIAVGASSVGGPPEYDSVAWHEQMFNERHLFQVEKDGEIVGGALLFSIEDGKMLYIGRIFVDPIHHRKGYGISLMELVESYYPSVKKIVLDTPIWNVRTNAFYKKLGYSEVKRDEEFVYYQKELD